MTARKKPDWSALIATRDLLAGIDFGPSGAAVTMHARLNPADLVDAANNLAAARARLTQALGQRVLAQKTASDALTAARADRQARTRSRRNLAMGA